MLNRIMPLTQQPEIFPKVRVTFVRQVRLPPRVGEPAGGSLSADAYKMATTGPLVMIVSGDLLCDALRILKVVFSC